MDNTAIYIVDDSKLSQKILIKSLSQYGYVTHEIFESAEAFLTKLPTIEPVLIFIDWMMPGMDGVSLSEEIKKVNKIRDFYTYCVLYTGEESLKSREGIYDKVDYIITKNEVNDFIQGPLMPAFRLSKLVNQLLLANKSLKE